MSMMNLYGQDFSLIDFGFSDPSIMDYPSFFRSSRLISSAYDHHPPPPPPPMPYRKTSPPKHRHDGTSPLPLGMDWSPPPRKWEGRNSVWPHDCLTGWSYCVTIPSWVISPTSQSPDPVVFYRVQVGVQSPEGVTSTRLILRRFNDFLKLCSELKKEFPKKCLPTPPPKMLLKMNRGTLLIVNRGTLLEERRRSLEDWLEKLFSDIELSRSAPAANFLELEAAARSSFYDSNQNVSGKNLTVGSVVSQNSNASLVSDTSFSSFHGNDSANEESETGTPGSGSGNHEFNMENMLFDKNSDGQTSESIKDALKGNVEDHGRSFQHCELIERDNITLQTDKVKKFIPTAESDQEDDIDHFGTVAAGSTCSVCRISPESLESDSSSVRASEISNLLLANAPGHDSFELSEGAEASKSMDVLACSNIQFSGDLLIAIPSNDHNKMNRVLIAMLRRIATAKTDMEDLIARLNQELAARKYLTTKVKDLEVELETTKQSGKDNMQQSVLIERERFTQMQWDIEELKRECMEMELKLKSEQDEKLQIETTKAYIIQEKDMLLQELDATTQELQNLQKHYEESELKSKADVKLLVKEVKYLRSSLAETRQEVSIISKEKLGLERALQQEIQKRGYANTANAKLLHECEILRSRLEECSVKFLVEEEDKLIMDTSSTSEAIDLLETSDNRIGLLVAEAQLLSQDIENSAAAAIHDSRGGGARTSDDELRMMLTDVVIDNARLRKQMNSLIRCSLSPLDRSKREMEEISLRKTVLSKFLER